jgi:hypothetical protein
MYSALMKRTGIMMLLVVSPVALGSQGVSELNPSAVWASAVLAKGGHERLGATTNVVRTTTQRRWWGFPPRPYEAETVTLIEPPGRMWRWIDERPTKLGYFVELIDLDRAYYGTAWSSGGVTTGTPDVAMVPFGEEQLIIWLETAGMAVRPTRVWRDRWKGQPVSVVEIDLAGRTAWCTFNDAHLMVRLVFPKMPGRLAMEYALDDYRPVQGIWLPHRVHTNAGGLKFTQQVSYQVNVSYAPGLFSRPPSVQGGPDGWRDTSAGVPK